MSRLEIAGHTEIAKAQKRIALTLVTITHIVFTQILHVMNIHTHIVAESMRHEQA